MAKSLSCALAAALVLAAGAPAFAAQTSAAESAAQKSADHDFGKLSVDGQSALRDIRMVRLEIFDGQIDRAKTDVAKAMSSLNKAQSDETVFTKAEADLKPPAAMRGNSTEGGSTPAGSTPAGSTQGAAMQPKAQPATAAAAGASATPIEWLPVAGAMTLGEDYVSTPDKTAGVNKANEKLAKGDKKGAIDELKIANVDVNFLVEVAPLKATLAGVKQADDELKSGKYYEANQSLKSVEDGMRFDSETLVATPAKSGAVQSGKSSG